MFCITLSATFSVRFGGPKIAPPQIHKELTLWIHPSIQERKLAPGVNIAPMPCAFATASRADAMPLRCWPLFHA